MAQPDEAPGRHVLYEATHELGASPREDTGSAAVAAIAAADADVPFSDREDSLLPDGDAVGVAGEVGVAPAPAGDRSLPVHDPGLRGGSSQGGGPSRAGVDEHSSACSSALSVSQDAENGSA